MMQINMKRCLSLVLALALTFSMLPVSVLAEEEETQPIAAEATVPTEVTEVPSEAPEETTVPVLIIEETAPVMAATESTALQIVQAKMDDILEYYLGTTDLTEEEAVVLVTELNPYDTAAADKEIYELEYSDEFQTLTEDEHLTLVENNAVFCAFAQAVANKAATEGAVNIYTDITTILNGQITISDTANKGSATNSTTYTTGTDSGTLLSKKANNITITNNTGKSIILSFRYAASNYNSFTIAGVTPSASPYTVNLDAGGTLAIYLQSNSGWSAGAASLTLDGFSITDVSAAYDVTFEYSSAMGSITVGGIERTSGYVAEDVSASTGIALTATVTNSSFLGWVNEDTHERLSTSASYTFKPSADCTVRAAFATASSDAWFLVDNTYLTDDLNTAATLGSTIVLMHDGILSSGDYTIPSGVTLLIPYDSAHTLHTTKPGDDGNSTHTIPSVYRKLTMASGANITVNGSISIGGKIGTYMVTSDNPSVPYTNGAPSGPLGFIDMADDSTITVNSDGNLYAWGFITGSGGVTVKSGGSVYEDLQLRDYRGGDATSSMIENTQKVFPFNQYYIQNIEVPLTLESGATENVCMAVSVSYVGVQKSNAVFIGKDAGLIRLSSGSITRTYDGSKDRIIYDLNGAVSFANLNVSIKVNALGTITIDSEDYVMPITNNMTLNANAGSAITVNQDLALLPGSEVNIAQGATVTLSSGNRLYVYDQDAWVKGYASITGKLFSPVYYAPGRTYDRVAADLVDAKVLVNGTVDATAGCIYTTASGANICSTGTGVVQLVPGTETVTYQVNQSGTDITSYPEISITPAQLKNRDGNYVTTGRGTTATTYKYDGETGKWHIGECSPTSESTLPTHYSTGTITSSCKCGLYDETTESMDKVAMLSAFGASAAEEIILDLKFLLPDTLEGGTATVVKQKKISGITDTKTYTISVANKTVTPATEGDTGAYFDSQGRFIVSRGIASGEMTRDVSVIFKDSSGNIVKVRYGNTMADIQDSVARNIRDYSELVLDQGDEKQQSLIKALLTYGGYAQLAFDVDSGNPAYELLTEKGIAIPTLPVEIDVDETGTTTAAVVSDGDIDETNGIITKSTLDKLTVSIKNQAFLDSAIYFRVYFTLAEGESIDSYTVSYNVPVANKDGESVTLEPVYDAANARYYVDIPDIPSGYLDYPYSITFIKSEESLTVKTSVLAYLKRLLESDKSTDAQKNLARAMYQYNQAANTFFDR